MDRTKKRKKLESIDKLLILMVIVTVLIVTFNSTFRIECVDGSSMEDTLHNEDIILVNYRVSADDLSDRDIVILDTAYMKNYKQHSPSIIKRYYADLSTTGLYVLGDNAEISYDSRYFGEAEKEALRGKMVINFGDYPVVNKILKFILLPESRQKAY